MKTPEEIKQSIRICAILDENHDCTTCPRYPDEYTDCSNALLMDALAYIEQLEETICLMKIQMHGDCGVCKHRTGFDVEGAIMSQKCYECLKKESRPNWEYEGLPEV